MAIAMEATGLLRITVVKAMHLNQLDPLEKCDAFATLSIGEHRAYTKAISVQDKNPTWNETFALPVQLQPSRRRPPEQADVPITLVSADVLQVEVHERDMLMTEIIGKGQLTIGDLPQGVAVPRTLRLGGSRSRLMILLEANGFGLPEEVLYRGSTGRLKVHVVRAVALNGSQESPPNPIANVEIGHKCATTRCEVGTREPDWRESFDLTVKLWPDTKEAAEMMCVAVYNGNVGERCLGAGQVDISEVCTTHHGTTSIC